MAEETTVQYDGSAIKTLSALEHIRLRPGMYIGRMGDGSHPDDGIYILIKEIKPELSHSYALSVHSDFFQAKLKRR